MPGWVIAFAVALSVTAVAQQSFSILGRWEATIPGRGARVSYQFVDSVRVIWEVEDPGAHQRTYVVKARYKLDRGTEPWTIDITNFEDRSLKGMMFRGIIKLQDDGSLVMEGRPSNLGGRPTEFSTAAVAFVRVK